VRHESDPPGMGVAFKELSEDSRVLIERLMASHGRGV
jgi:hypothetical protein